MSRKKRPSEEHLPFDQQLWYDEMHSTQVKLKLNNKTDRDILDWISRKKRDSRKPAQDVAKRLIRKKIARTISESCLCTLSENPKP